MQPSRLTRAMRVLLPVAVLLGAMSCGDNLASVTDNDTAALAARNRRGRVVVTLDSSQITVASRNQARVAVYDANGRIVTGTSITWSTNNSSVATVDAVGLVTGQAAGAAGITARSGLISGTASLMVVNAVVKTVAGPTALAIVTQPSSAANSCVAFAVQPIAELRDTSNVAVAQAGVSVTASIASGGGTLGGTATATTDAAGRAAFSGLSVCGTSGSRTLAFSSTGLLTATSNAILVTAPATATQLVVTLQPSASATSGVAFVQQPVVQLRDASNTAVSQSGIVVSASIATGGGSLGTLTAATNASGAATFTNLSITGIAGSRTLSFSSTGLTSATSQPISVAVSGPVSDEPVFDATKGTVIMQDNMDSYVSATAMGAVPLTSLPRIAPSPSPVLVSQPVNESKESLITGRGGVGHALGLNYSGVYQDSREWEAFNVPIPNDTATHYFQYWGRITMSAPLTGTLAIKFFEAWHRNLDRVQWNTHSRDPGHPLASRSPSGTYWQVYDQGRGTFGQGEQPVGPYFDNVANGGWHRFTYSYRPQSRIGSRDGFVRMWIDGVKVIDISAATLNVTPPGGDKVWCGTEDLDAIAVNEGIRVIVWGSTQTTDTPPFTYDIDDFIWWIKK